MFSKCISSSRWTNHRNDKIIPLYNKVYKEIGLLYIKVSYFYCLSLFLYSLMAFLIAIFVNLYNGIPNLSFRFINL